MIWNRKPFAKEVMLMWIKKVMVLLFLTIFLVACKNPFSPESPASEYRPFLSFKGVVIDASSDSPIAGAFVNVRDRMWDYDRPLAYAFTDQEGLYNLNFRVTEECSEFWFLDVRADGYQTISVFEEYKIKCTTVIQIVNFRLVPREPY